VFTSALSRDTPSEAGEALELFIVADDGASIVAKEFGVHCRTSGPVFSDSSPRTAENGNGKLADLSTDDS